MHNFMDEIYKSTSKGSGNRTILLHSGFKIRTRIPNYCSIAVQQVLFDFDLKKLFNKRLVFPPLHCDLPIYYLSQILKITGFKEICSFKKLEIAAFNNTS